MSLPPPKSAGSASLASPSLGRLLADLLLVALGAIPGSLLRWLVEDLSVVNLLGAFVLGWLSATAAGRPRAWLLELRSGLFVAALGLAQGQWMQKRWPAQLGDRLKH